MTTEEVHVIFEQTLKEIVPDADLSSVPGDTDLRETFELDSLDFVELVERLSKRIGARIDEEDYDQLRTPDDAVRFLVAHAA